MVLNRDHLHEVVVTGFGRAYWGIYDENISYVYFQTETDTADGTVKSVEADKVYWYGQINTDAYFGRIPNFPTKAHIGSASIQTITYSGWVDIALDIARIGINPTKGGYGYEQGMFNETNRTNIVDILTIVEHFATKDANYDPAVETDRLDNLNKAYAKYNVR